MNNKYTFWELCEEYSKIEVPIIQRDYAQGRNTVEVEILRDKFVNDYLIKSILKNDKIELDFVYGSTLIEDNKGEKQKIFIPLDGQQRLTTLFLLHFFVALKEERLAEVKNTLHKFTYETRPSAHDFCKLLLEINVIDNLSQIKNEIEDSVWFNEEWKNDPTVSGMLIMLDSFSKNKSLINAPTGILDKLIDSNSNLVSFYFTDLDQFGLTENLYIRMNARGKMLTEFENFKSEFSKIISYNHDLLELVKDKIEYDWVDNLWDYRDSDSYIIDSPFMAFLSFLTEMIYFKDAEFRAKSYENNFLDFRVLKDVYSKEENLRLLIFSFDFIKEIPTMKESVLWRGETLHDIMLDILKGKTDTNQQFVFFLTILYSYNKMPRQNLYDYVRVVRNLIENTLDNSRREWPRLIESLKNLISKENVYEVLLDSNSGKSKLLGFNLEQRREELFKADLIKKHPESKALIFKIEDHLNFKGNIRNILITPFVKTEEELNDTKLELLDYEENHLKLLENTFDGYLEISKNNFISIWGNLIITRLYSQTVESRLIYSGVYKKHPSILIFAKEFSESKLNLKNYIFNIQKQYVLSLSNEFHDLSEVTNVKDQLYLYYIISERLYDQKPKQFFKNNNFNFGWLAKKNGYKTFFNKGIENCKYFETHNPIFQVYNQQFRYNLGLNKNNTLDIEIIDNDKIRDPFKQLIDWAHKN